MIRKLAALINCEIMALYYLFIYLFSKEIVAGLYICES